LLTKLKEYTKDLTLLYVEDDEILANEMKDLFKKFFKDIVLCKNGEKALKLYKEKEFDLVMSDIRMPKMDGIELATKIREINKDQAIIMLSAYSDVDNLLRLIKVGVSDFLLKPMEFGQLFDVLYKVCKNIYYKKENEKFLVQQAKMAQMGEMIDLIAHQWLQFTNIIGLKAEMLNLKIEKDEIDKEFIKNYSNDILNEVNELSNVLYEFRDFFKQKDKEEVLLNDIIKSCVTLLQDYLMKHVINLKIDVAPIKIQVYPNEFKQVIINIISNMVDNFVEKDISDREIKIYTKDYILYIEDNGGGIDEYIKNRIFDKNFTTKENGSGQGLYLAKMIIDKLGGKISVDNINNGICFKIELPKG